MSNQNRKIKLLLASSRGGTATAYKDLTYASELYRRDGSFVSVIKSFLNLTPRVLEYYFTSHRKQQANGSSAMIPYPRDITVTTVAKSSASQAKHANIVKQQKPVCGNRLLKSPSVLYSSIMSLNSDVDNIEPLPYSENYASEATEGSSYERSQLRYTVIEPNSQNSSATSLSESNCEDSEAQRVAVTANVRENEEDQDVWELPYLHIVDKVLIATHTTELWMQDRIKHRLPLPLVVKLDCARLKKAAELVLRLREGPKALTLSSVAVCGATGGAGFIAAGIVQQESKIARSFVDSTATLFGASASVVKGGLSLLLAASGITLAVQHVKKDQKNQRKLLLQNAYEVNYILRCKEWQNLDLHSERVSAAFGKVVVHDLLPDGPVVARQSSQKNENESCGDSTRVPNFKVHTTQKLGQHHSQTRAAGFRPKSN